MKEIYKDTFIYKVCEDLEITMKDLSFKMNRTLKCIENWRKDGSQIPSREKEYMNMLVETKKLKDIIISMEKHKVTLNDGILSDEFGGAIINFNIVKGTLKRLKKYKIILEEA